MGGGASTSKKSSESKYFVSRNSLILKDHFLLGKKTSIDVPLSSSFLFSVLPMTSLSGKVHVANVNVNAENVRKAALEYDGIEWMER